MWKTTSRTEQHYTLRIILSIIAAFAGLPSVSVQRNYTVYVDDQLMSFYINGISYKTTYGTYPLPASMSLIAAYVRNAGGNAGLYINDTAGEFSTDTTWKCTNVSESDWMGILFDDSTWKAAVYQNTHLGMTGIWTKSVSGAYLLVYCRSPMRNLKTIFSLIGSHQQLVPSPSACFSCPSRVRCAFECGEQGTSCHGFQYGGQQSGSNLCCLADQAAMNATKQTSPNWNVWEKSVVPK